MQDYEFIRPLGDAVKRARSELGLTQNEVAERIGVDVRTILNIENYRGNPKMRVVYPLIRLLQIDPDEVFYNNGKKKSPKVSRLEHIIADCSESEAQALIPVCESVIAAMRSNEPVAIE